MHPEDALDDGDEALPLSSPSVLIRDRTTNLKDAALSLEDVGSVPVRFS